MLLDGKGAHRVADNIMHQDFWVKFILHHSGVKRDMLIQYAAGWEVGS